MLNGVGCLFIMKISNVSRVIVCEAPVLKLYYVNREVRIENDASLCGVTYFKKVSQLHLLQKLEHQQKVATLRLRRSFSPLVLLVRGVIGTCLVEM